MKKRFGGTTDNPFESFHHQVRRNLELRMFLELVFKWSGSKPPQHTPIEKLWLRLPTDPDGSNSFQRRPCHTKVWNPWHDQGLFLSMLMSKFDHVRDSYGSWLRWLETFDEFLWSAIAANLVEINLNVCNATVLQLELFISTIFWLILWDSIFTHWQLLDTLKSHIFFESMASR